MSNTTCVTRVLQGFYKGVTRVVVRVVARVLQGFRKGVTRVLEGCYKGATPEKRAEKVG
jgi:hypothetical protein